MAYTSLGFSVADLAISGESAPTAAWGGTLTIQVTLRNLGASTIVEPTSLVPATQVQIGPDGAVVPSYYTPSQADAPDSTIAVYLVPKGKGPAGGLQIGTIDAPALSQNNIEQFQSTLTLPAQPAGFAASGNYTIRLVANADRSVLESNYRNNVSAPLNVKLLPAPALSALRVTAFDVPDGLSPGDTIAPYIQVSNLGNGALTSDVQVAVVASTSPDFNLGSSIVSIYTINGGIPGLSSVPLPNAARHGRGFRALQNSGIITPRSNVATIQGANATLPTSPSTYYIGVVIDPFNQLNLPNQPANRLELVKTVTTTANPLSPTGVSGSPGAFDFQTPPDGVAIGII
ncbi:hypothetical protein [Paludisphaera mucosa]|uniref:CARDB domain-containing protein n=1 Tax=Paludisphaera mucosa TaxID=3030827 RepID=A0ABT6FHD6_9BACT|nr:hypothetical protein [Paludisphaera mucosa]MDG3006998.1 hypothetical protein [Paludisphaera mucosa]